jgi:hypothetical protein
MPATTQRTEALDDAARRPTPGRVVLEMNHKGTKDTKKEAKAHESNE